MTEPSRIHRRNDEACAPDRQYVLYWMQASVRSRSNHALEYAIERANALNKPLLAVFGLTDDYPEANARHYAFLLQGLRDAYEALSKRRIKLLVRRGAPDDVALALAGDACVLVCDRGYLRQQRSWRERVAREAPCEVVEVESDLVVPVETASDKQEWAARTIRRKLTSRWSAYLSPVETATPRKDSRPLAVTGDVDPRDPQSVLASLDVDTAVAPVSRFEGGEQAAGRALEAFLEKRLDGYDKGRNQPGDWGVSFMSPYLHFGQISPLEIALAVREAGEGIRSDVDAYLEELLVRRELSANYVWFCDDYDRYAALPAWARTTLEEHRDDPREHVYTRAELEAGETHDRYWNAAMCEMRETGFMHNYMRMYWGKKIIEWTNTPEYAFRTALALNNRYFLDGRDANSFVGVAWCFGLHDRAWTERAVFGKVRYMNAAGLERKFDMQRYIDGVQDLTS